MLCEKKYKALILALSPFTCAASTQSINIEVLSATVKDKKIDDAAVILQKNGAQSVTARSDSAGRAVLNAPFEMDQDSLLIIKKEGYSDLVVKCLCDGMTYAISPVMKNLDGMRIVLTWGEKSFDLDSHLIYPDNHIYFCHKNGRNANLDVDDTDSFGPETITIDKKYLGESYIYAVHDYSNGDKANSPALSASSAKVFVYVGSSQVRSYSVPLNKVGNIWTVFHLNPNGDFEDINAVGEADFTKVKDSDVLPMVLNPAQTAVAVTGNTVLAKNLNRDGEAAYGRGELEQATTLFLARSSRIAHLVRRTVIWVWLISNGATLPKRFGLTAKRLRWQTAAMRQLRELVRTTTSQNLRECRPVQRCTPAL
ncbi:hypothetical protein PEC302107_25660 [Pectobacterium araliae]|uniref:Uncharacterized protein n=1 Tax=Pectobacterium araliae TaxID=3073862 RepID=A0AAN0MK61_9GAMM|nr:hypothetical protein PEC302110_12200 [Pectobacterium sp. MAFF 302110]GKW20837.1 hypothetical protein PEC302107_25660 [Pectobacterium carotovorum subsp. carotovorum]